METIEMDVVDVEPLPLPTDDDDDVFENDNTLEPPTDGPGNKRRSQSLSSLQSTKDLNSQVKVIICIGV